MTDDIAALIERLRYPLWTHNDEWQNLDHEATKRDLNEAADALSRLTTPPLPDEIAGLIEDVLSPRSADHEDRAKRVAAALRALAQERDNLKAEIAIAVKWHEQDAADYNELRDERDFFDAECQEHAATIAACVVERDEWKMKYESEVRLVDSIEAERDAIRAKIEKCLSAVSNVNGDWQAMEAILAESRDLAVANRNYWQAEASAIRAKTFKDCAKLCDEWLEHFGDGDIKYTSATKYASDAVKDIAEAFRAFAQTDEKIDTSELLRQLR